jgi:membrane-associated PAP2 superfamily phosphatase
MPASCNPLDSNHAAYGPFPTSSARVTAYAPPPWRIAGFHHRHLKSPLMVVAGLFVAANLFHADLWLADRLYAWEGHAWTLRHAWVTEELIHLLGRDFSIAAWLTVLAAWSIACVRPRWAHLRRPLLYLLVATALPALLVSGLKSLSNIDCPWDLARYGGTRPYLGLFEPRGASLGRGLCFPAGHASGGYAWVALYFFLTEVRPPWRGIGLAAGLAIGLLFGISQQLRGAHFLSHDLAALAICWSCAVVTHHIFWRDALPPSRTTEAVAAR